MAESTYHEGVLVDVGIFIVVHECPHPDACAVLEFPDERLQFVSVTTAIRQRRILWKYTVEDYREERDRNHGGMFYTGYSSSVIEPDHFSSYDEALEAGIVFAAKLAAGRVKYGFGGIEVE